MLYIWNERKVGHLAGKVVLKGTDVEGFVDLAVTAFSHLGHGEWWTGKLFFKGWIEDEWWREESYRLWQRIEVVWICGLM